MNMPSDHPDYPRILLAIERAGRALLDKIKREEAALGDDPRLASRGNGAGQREQRAVIDADKRALSDLRSHFPVKLTLEERMPAPRRCKCGCGASIDHKHPNAEFLSQKHKDRYWNRANPRGIYAHLNPRRPEYDPEAGRHPHDIDQD